MTEGIIIAIIGAGGAIVAALIAGIFTVIKSSKESKSSVKIKQKGRNNTQIGQQNNYNNSTTVQFGDITASDGTFIIDGGTASGGGGIKYEPSTNETNSGEKKDD